VPLTERGLNRATLHRQLLLRREPLGVVDAVRRVVALQAQSPASPYLALWNRIADFDPADLDAAYVEHDVVKAQLMRITLHAVHAEDYPAFQHAMVSSLRAARLNDPRYRDTGLTTADADAMLGEVLAFTAEPRTNAEVEAWLEERLGRPVPRAWWALRTFAPVVHAATGGPWSHRQRPAYRTARTPPATGDPVESVHHLIRRYLEGFGPATPQDIAMFTILRAPVVRQALDAMASSLEVMEGPGGSAYYDVPGGALPDEAEPAPPRLMAMWDSTLLAYADRGRLVPDDYRAAVIRRNGDVLATLLVDGYVAGVWRAVEDGIEATAFRKLSAAAWRGLRTEAKALVAFLASREPRVYSRYAHWWDGLPAAEVRLLA
jgi:DNA glycosylase AlkZ-like